jgi:hypothetical protein
MVRSSAPVVEGKTQYSEGVGVVEQRVASELVLLITMMKS